MKNNEALNEALKALDEFTDQEGVHFETAEPDAFLLIYTAVMKQIPQKVVIKPRVDRYFSIEHCPRCDSELLFWQPYCNKCGQAVDWREE